METKHTPGPWHVATKRIFGKASVHDVNDGTVAATRIGNRKGYAHTEAEDQANARLIAAAPDLLEHCETLVAALNRRLSGNTNHGNIDELALLNARDAITKATQTP